jgi:hypothetical protein
MTTATTTPIHVICCHHVITVATANSSAATSAAASHAKAARHCHEEVKHLAAREPALAHARAAPSRPGSLASLRPTVLAPIHVYSHRATCARRNGGGIARVVAVSHEHKVSAARHLEPRVRGRLQQSMFRIGLVHCHTEHH